MATKNKALTEDQKREIGQVVRNKVLAGLLIVLTLLGGIAGVSLWEIYNHVQKKVENLVAQQFEEPRIKEIVENTAKNKASTLMSEQINPEVIKFKGDMALKITKADEKLSEMDAQIRDANAQIQKLNSLYHVLLIADIAKSGSKKAYLELERFAAKENTEEGVVAQNNLKEIKRNLEQYRHTNKNIFTQMPLVFKQQGKEVSIGNEPVTVLVNSLIISNFSDEYRQILMRYIAKKPKEEIFREALRVFESDSLPACAIFCGILSEISEEKADFLDFDAWTKICKKQVDKQ